MPAKSWKSAIDHGSWMELSAFLLVMLYATLKKYQTAKYVMVRMVPNTVPGSSQCGSLALAVPFSTSKDAGFLTYGDAGIPPGVPGVDTTGSDRLFCILRHWTTPRTSATHPTPIKSGPIELPS